MAMADPRGHDGGRSQRAAQGMTAHDLEDFNKGDAFEKRSFSRPRV
jgi:hypothetical protein